MTILTQAALQKLIQATPEPGVSFYFTASASGQGSSKEIIQWKNLMHEAERQLAERGLEPKASNRILSKAKTLLTNGSFWQKAQKGVAIFASSNHFSYYFLPYEVTNKVTVDNAFYIIPLLKATLYEKDFYILALSLANAHLVYCSHGQGESIFLKDVPHSLEEEFQYVALEEHLQTHGNANYGRAGFVHGHGGQKDEGKNDITLFFRMIDKAIQKLFLSNKNFVILAGTERHLSRYRQLSHYPYYLDKAIIGNADLKSDKELAQEGYQLLAETFTINADTVANKYASLIANGKGSIAPEAILVAAHSGRIHEMLINGESELWGKFDPETMSVDLHRKPLPYDHELINLATIETIKNNGQVHIQEDFQEPILATYRY
ncbi:MAG: hypothetical protein HY817_01770 [Candidatus Abawacabacteria bacterium]|nr:hypothetical protein [Candidatus Abawacabacteria bacterium]